AKRHNPPTTHHARRSAQTTDNAAKPQTTQRAALHNEAMRPVASPSESNVSRGFVHLREGIEAFLRFARGKVWEEASMRERLHALSVAVRRPMLDAMRETERRYQD